MFVGVVLGWAVVLAMLGRHRIVVSHDSLSNYTHVWWIEHRFWHSGRVPWRFPALANGHGIAFPYGFLPWVAAALLWPLLGEWSVTLCLVLGSAGALLAMLWAFPELGRGWWAAAALANPALVDAPIVGMMPFLWALSFLFAGIGSWRRGRRRNAAVFVALAQVTHPAVAIPIAMLIVTIWWRWERDRRALLAHYSIATAASLPAVAAVFAAPVMSRASIGVMASQFAETVLVRAAIVLVPVAILMLMHVRWQWLAPVVFTVTLAANVALIEPLDTAYAWGSLSRQPSTTVDSYVQSSFFRRGAVYRVLGFEDGKYSSYRVVRAGGRLDADMFPESIVRRSFTDVDHYARFLARRHVDYVWVLDNYDRRYGTNEHALLSRWAGEQTCVSASIRATVQVHATTQDVYSIEHCTPA